jgi:3-keto-disaccharide hydrolase
MKPAQLVIRALSRRLGTLRLTLWLIIVAALVGLALVISIWLVYRNATVFGLRGDDRLKGWNDSLDWTVKYDGYGEVDIEDGFASLKPRPAQGPSETSAALALAGDPDWRDYSFTVQMNLQQQLRQNSPPNPWEAGWLFFRYQSDYSSYYLIHKPNGLEIGKLVRPASENYTSDNNHVHNQVFLATTSGPPAEPGRWYDYRIDVRGATIQVYVDGELQITYTDPDPIMSGRVGLYTEDAHVLFQDPLVNELSSNEH